MNRTPFIAFAVVIALASTAGTSWWRSAAPPRPAVASASSPGDAWPDRYIRASIRAVEP